MIIIIFIIIIIIIIIIMRYLQTNGKLPQLSWAARQVT